MENLNKKINSAGSLVVKCVKINVCQSIYDAKNVYFTQLRKRLLNLMAFDVFLYC